MPPPEAVRVPLAVKDVFGSHGAVGLTHRETPAYADLKRVYARVMPEQGEEERWLTLSA